MFELLKRKKKPADMLDEETIVTVGTYIFCQLLAIVIITYGEAEFKARTKIYQSVKPDFNPDVEYMKDPLSRDIPSVDNSLFIIARKLLLDSKF